MYIIICIHKVYSITNNKYMSHVGSPKVKIKFCINQYFCTAMFDRISIILVKYVLCTKVVVDMWFYPWQISGSTFSMSTCTGISSAMLFTKCHLAININDIVYSFSHIPCHSRLASALKIVCDLRERLVS